MEEFDDSADEVDGTNFLSFIDVHSSYKMRKCKKILWITSKTRQKWDWG